MKNIKTQIEIPKVENSCFVVMPFDTLFSSQYEKIIRPAVSEIGLECIRGDEIYSRQRIMDDIWESIRSCRLVIAEMTGRNPNVLYEIGLAHAIGKPVIIITRNTEDVPFDLKDLRYLFYDVNDPFWGDNLKLGLQNLINKVLENPTIGTYLQGILNSTTIEYPTISPEKKPIKQKATHDLTGLWQGISNADRLTAMEHEISMHITQEDTELIATATISYYSNESKEPTVVHEILSGTINKSIVKLKGVNYSYVNRGGSINYKLDDFNLVVDSKNRMTGTDVSEGSSKSYDVVLERKPLPNKE